MWLCAWTCFQCKVISKPKCLEKASWTQDHLVCGVPLRKCWYPGCLPPPFIWKCDNMDGRGVSSPWWTCLVNHEMENTNKFQKGSHVCWLGMVVSICSYFLFQKISIKLTYKAVDFHINAPLTLRLVNFPSVPHLLSNPPPTFFFLVSRSLQNSSLSKQI